MSLYASVCNNTVVMWPLFIALIVFKNSTEKIYVTQGKLRENTGNFISAKMWPPCMGVYPRGCLLRDASQGLSAQGGGVCLGGCLPRSVCLWGCLPGGGVCPGGCLPRGVWQTHPQQETDTLPPWTEWLTDRCKTLPWRNFVAGSNKQSSPVSILGSESITRWLVGAWVGMSVVRVATRKILLHSECKEFEWI